MSRCTLIYALLDDFAHVLPVYIAEGPRVEQRTLAEQIFRQRIAPSLQALIDHVNVTTLHSGHQRCDASISSKFAHFRRDHSEQNSYSLVIAGSAGVVQGRAPRRVLPREVGPALKQCLHDCVTGHS